MVFQLRTLADAHEFQLRRSNVGLMNRLEGLHVLDERKKARPDAGTSGQAMREHTLESVNSQKQYNFPGGGGQGSISSLLMHGCENGLHLADLVRLTGWPEREVRRQIQFERKAGHLILSDCEHGYFLPGEISEVRRFIRSMSRRSSEIATISRAAEDTLARLIGQERVRGWVGER